MNITKLTVAVTLAAGLAVTLVAPASAQMVTKPTPFSKTFKGSWGSVSCKNGNASYQRAGGPLFTGSCKENDAGGFCTKNMKQADGTGGGGGCYDGKGNPA
jgi:hypothetical protein